MPFNAVFSWIIKKRMDQIDLFKNNPIVTQENLLKNLLSKANESKQHQSAAIKNMRSSSDELKNLK